MLETVVLGKLVTNNGMTATGIAPVGTKLLRVTGPVPFEKLPWPWLVPSNTTAVGLAQIISLSLS